MDRFIIPPLVEGYSFTPGQNLIEQERGFAMPRQRVAGIGMPHTVRAAIFCENPLEEKYFWSFWRKKQRMPGRFLWAIKTDNYELEDHECMFSAQSVPNTNVMLAGQTLISFELWVQPLQRDADLDEMIVEYYNAGFNPRISNLLEHLVNVVMPENLG